jgi:hypothetical protein
MTTMRMTTGREDLHINMVLKITETNVEEIIGKVKVVLEGHKSHK